MKVRPLRISCGRLTGEAPQRQPCSEGWGSGGFAAGVQLFAPPPLRGRHCFPFPLLPLLLTSVTWWPIEHREVKLHDSGGQIYVGTQLLPLSLEPLCWSSELPRLPREVLKPHERRHWPAPACPGTLFPATSVPPLHLPPQSPLPSCLSTPSPATQHPP